LIQDREVHGHSNLFAEYPHKWKRDVGDVEVGLRVAAETQNFQAQTIPPGFRFASKIAAFFEGSKDVARGAFGYSEFAADFRVGESIAALRGGFQNIQGALDRDGGTGV